MTPTPEAPDMFETDESDPFYLEVQVTTELSANSADRACTTNDGCTGTCTSSCVSR